MHHPFLQPQRLLEILNQIYMTETSSDSAQDKYTLLMVFAVASVRTHRDGLTDHHPYGYFLAAQNLIAHVSVLGSIEAIQNLLLVARFGMYYDIGIILRLTMLCTNPEYQVRLCGSFLTFAFDNASSSIFIAIYLNLKPWSRNKYDAVFSGIVI